MKLSPEASVGDLARAGALGRAVRRVWMNWQPHQILTDMQEHWPGLAWWKYENVLIIAQQEVIAAKLLRSMARHETINPDDVPLLPP